jgi:hypothetical protein
LLFLVVLLYDVLTSSLQLARWFSHFVARESGNHSLLRLCGQSLLHCLACALKTQSQPQLVSIDTTITDRGHSKPKRAKEAGQPRSQSVAMDGGPSALSEGAGTALVRVRRILFLYYDLLAKGMGF